MKKIFLLSIVALVSIILAACGSDNASGDAKGDESSEKSEELSIKHELGESTVQKNPENVVVFDYGALDSLDKLGVEVAGIPQSSLPSYLSKYEDESYENVGSLKEPDFEKINEMQPELIIISGRQASLYEEFKEIAPTIYIGVDTTRYLDSFKENMATLGKIFDKQSLVEEEVAKIETSINQLNEKASAMDENALIVLANDGKVSAYGAGSRFGIIHDEFGVKPVDENIEASTHGMSISFEYIVEKDPDRIFVIDRGAVVGGESSAKQVVENELVKTTSAYKNDNIIYLDPNYWYLSGGGLVSVSEMAKEVAAGLE